VFLPRKNPDTADYCRQPSNSLTQSTADSVVLMSLPDGESAARANVIGVLACMYCLVAVK
jgi:hypothetical protein